MRFTECDILDPRSPILKRRLYPSKKKKKYFPLENLESIELRIGKLSKLILHLVYNEHLFVEHWTTLSTSDKNKPILQHNPLLLAQNISMPFILIQ